MTFIVDDDDDDDDDDGFTGKHGRMTSDAVNRC